MGPRIQVRFFSDFVSKSRGCDRWSGCLCRSQTLLPALFFPHHVWHRITGTPCVLLAMFLANAQVPTAVWVPTFRGGSARYTNLQNSIFVGSETVSDSEVPGQFLIGVKISKVFATKTNITIGEEFP